MVTARQGHSLPELIVALTLLGATLVGVMSTAVLGSRWTADGVRRQQALTQAETAMDSLAALPVCPDPGGAAQPARGWVVRWDVEPVADLGAARVRVAVTVGQSDRPLAVLHGLWVPPIPGPLP